MDREIEDYEDDDEEKSHRSGEESDSSSSNKVSMFAIILQAAGNPEGFNSRGNRAPLWVVALTTMSSPVHVFQNWLLSMFYAGASNKWQQHNLVSLDPGDVSRSVNEVQDKIGKVIASIALTNNVLELSITVYDELCDYFTELYSSRLPSLSLPVSGIKHSNAHENNKQRDHGDEGEDNDYRLQEQDDESEQLSNFRDYNNTKLDAGLRLFIEDALKGVGEPRKVLANIPHILTDEQVQQIMGFIEDEKKEHHLVLTKPGPEPKPNDQIFGYSATLVASVFQGVLVYAAVYGIGLGFADSGIASLVFHGAASAAVGVLLGSGRRVSGCVSGAFVGLGAFAMQRFAIDVMRDLPLFELNPQLMAGLCIVVLAIGAESLALSTTRMGTIKGMPSIRAKAEEVAAGFDQAFPVHHFVRTSLREIMQKGCCSKRNDFSDY
ncbi:MAG: hypothetical protein JSS50_02705 [Proteobacteria bacterium]|nr:hypothetical protein [Pseudomonadota bacterium]